MVGLNTAQIMDMARSMGANISDSQAGSILKSAWDQGQWGADAGKVKSLLSGYSSSSSSSSNYQPTNVNKDDIINDAIKRYQEANKPAVASLQAGIPETQAKYAQMGQQAQARIDPLKARYENLINEIKYTGQVQEQRQTKVTSAELAKRGLLPSSTLAQQEITDVLQPITQQTGYQVSNMGLQQEDAIRDIEDYIASLGPKETEELRLARNAIAQLQSGAANSGITTGVSMYQQAVADENARQAAAADASYKNALLASQNFQNQLAQRELEEYKIPSLTKSTSSGGMDISSLYNLFNPPASTPNKPKSKPNTKSSSTGTGSFTGIKSSKSSYA